MNASTCLCQLHYYDRTWCLHFKEMEKDVKSFGNHNQTWDVQWTLWGLFSTKVWNLNFNLILICWKFCFFLWLNTRNLKLGKSSNPKYRHHAKVTEHTNLILFRKSMDIKMIMMLEFYGFPQEYMRDLQIAKDPSLLMSLFSPVKQTICISIPSLLIVLILHGKIPSASMVRSLRIVQRRQRYGRMMKLFLAPENSRG